MCCCRSTTLVSVIAVAAVSLVAAGCGGAGSSGAPNSAAAQAQGNAALDFSRCMRSRGVSSFADPNGRGQLPKETPQQLGVSGSRFEAAQTACQHLLLNGGQPTSAALQQSWSDFRKFARCMRRHGVTTWPDPTRYPEHPERPTFNLQAVGLDPSTRQTANTIHNCLPLLHGNNPQRLGEGGA